MALQTLAAAPPTVPFWTRRTLLYAACGVLVALFTAWLPDSLLVLGPVSAIRLGASIFVAAAIMRLRERPTGEKTPWHAALLLFSFAYPFQLLFTLYVNREIWLPQAAIDLISNPTGFLLFLAAGLLTSLVWTAWLVSLAAGTEPDTMEKLRQLGQWLFLLTCISVAVSYPPWSVFLLRWVAQPVALGGFSAVAGWAWSREAQMAGPPASSVSSA